MSDEQPDKAKEAAPKGAVEVDEKDLDQAAGGVLDGAQLPAESLSLNYAKVEFSQAQKVNPQIPAGGPHVAPEKKI